MPDRFRKLRTRHRPTFTIHYWEDRLTGRVFTTVSVRGFR